MRSSRREYRTRHRLRRLASQRAASAAAFAALLLAGCNGTEPARPQETPPREAAGEPTEPEPTKDDAMTEHPFNLQGDEYWTSPFKNVRALEDLTIRKFAAGLLLDAPPEVDLATRPTVPAHLFACTTQKDAYAMPLPRGTVFVATRLEDRQTFVGFAMTRELPLPPSGPAPRPGDDEDEDDSWMTSTLSADLRERLSLPPDTGTYSVVALLRDRASNQVKVALRKAGAPYTDPEVEKFLAGQPVPAPAPVDPLPGDPLPSYTRTAGTPPVPVKPGIALTAPRVFPVTDASPAVVSASFRVPVLRRERVPTGHTYAGPAVNGKAPTAVVPVRLLVLSSDGEAYGPFQMRLRVPSYDPVPEDADAVSVTGCVSVDLFAFPGVERRAVTYFVYAFVGEWMAGPASVGIVTKDMLRK